MQEVIQSPLASKLTLLLANAFEIVQNRPKHRRRQRAERFNQTRRRLFQERANAGGVQLAESNFVLVFLVHLNGGLHQFVGLFTKLPTDVRDFFVNRFERYFGGE